MPLPSRMSMTAGIMFHARACASLHHRRAPVHDMVWVCSWSMMACSMTWPSISGGSGYDRCCIGIKSNPERARSTAIWEGIPGPERHPERLPRRVHRASTRRRPGRGAGAVLHAVDRVHGFPVGGRVDVDAVVDVVGRGGHAARSSTQPHNPEGVSLTYLPQSSGYNRERCR